MNEQKKIEQEILPHITFGFAGASSTESKFLEGKLSFNESINYLSQDCPALDMFRKIEVLKEDIAEQNHLIFRVIKAYSVVLEVHYEELACQDTTHGSTTHECTDRHLNSVASKLLQSYVE